MMQPVIALWRHARRHWFDALALAGLISPATYNGHICRRFLWPSFPTNGLSQSVSAASLSAIVRAPMRAQSLPIKVTNPLIRQSSASG